MVSSFGFAVLNKLGMYSSSEACVFSLPSEHLMGLMALLGRDAIAFMSTCSLLYSMRDSYLDYVYRVVVSYLVGVVSGHEHLVSFMVSLGCDNYLWRTPKHVVSTGRGGRFYLAHLFVLRSCSTSELYMLVDVLRTYSSYRRSWSTLDLYLPNRVLSELSTERSYAAVLSGDNVFLSTILEGVEDEVDLQRLTLLSHWNHFVCCIHGCERKAGRLYFPAGYVPFSFEDENFTYECWLLFLLYQLYYRDNFVEHYSSSTLSYVKTEFPSCTLTMHPISSRLYLEFDVHYRLGTADDRRFASEQAVNLLISACALIRKARSSVTRNISDGYMFSSDDYSSLRELYARFYYYLGLNKITQCS